MAISPGIRINEIDESQFVQQGQTGNGAIVGQFQWGPILERNSFASRVALETTHGTITDDNFHTTLAARNFFSYGPTSLIATRVVGASSMNAGIGAGIAAINNEEAFSLLAPANRQYTFVTKFPGELGNRVVVDTYNFDGATANERLSLSQIDQTIGVNVRLYAESINSAVAVPLDAGSTTNFDLSELGLSQIGNIYVLNGVYAKLVQPFDPASTAVIQSFAEAVFNFEIITFSVVENYIVSLIVDHQDDNGNIDYIADVINAQSNYVYVGTEIGNLFNEDSVELSDGDNSTTTFDLVAAQNTIVNDDYTVGADGTVDITSGFTVAVGGTTLTPSTDYSIRNKFETESFDGDNSTTTFALTDAALETLIETSYFDTPDVDFSNFYVTVGGVVQEETTDFTVTRAGANDYSLVFTTAPATGTDNIVIRVFEPATYEIVFSTAPATGTDNISITIVDEKGNRQFLQFTGGVETDISLAEYQAGWDLYLSTNQVQVEILLTDACSKFVADDCRQANEYVVRNIAATRRESWAIVSPPTSIYTSNLGNRANMKTAIIDFRNSLNIGGKDAEYGFLVNDIKQQTDPVSGKLRWVPLTADIAGLAAAVSDPWVAFAGYRRGILRNIGRLAYDAVDLGDRDDFFARQINPVFTQIGAGVVLLGDSTLVQGGTAFNQIGVRRLFIFIERSIRALSRTFLFEFNDVFTRRQYFNIVQPFLADIQARRGIVDFRAVVDETNNTPEVITRNEFVADFRIDPSRSIRNITLNFVATRAGQVEIETA